MKKIIDAIISDFVTGLTAMPKTLDNLTSGRVMLEKSITLLTLADLTMDRQEAEAMLKAAYKKANP